MKAIFDLARSVKPCIVFMDELDCIFKQRANFGHESKLYVSEFLILLDKVADQDGAYKDCFFIGATNRLADIDEAVLRRFPLKIDIKKPVILDFLITFHISIINRAPLLKTLLKFSSMIFWEFINKS